jgi:uncharacterized protein GlcG (DUF336 family)
MSDILNFKTLTLNAAKKIAAVAVLKAQELGVPGAIAIVDAFGSLIYLEKLDGTMPGASNLAIGKAQTAIAFQRETIKLESLIQQQRMVMIGLNAATDGMYVPLMGAYPILIDGQMVGAVGIAGALIGENDEIIAKHTALIVLNQ